MGNLKKYYMAIKNGDIFFDEYRKSVLILIAVILMHIMFAFFFGFAGVISMVIYNICTVFIYTGIMFLIKKQKTYLAFTLTSVEVILHAVLATIMVGYSSGFQLYCVVMLAVSCYITFTWECFKKGKLETFLFSFLSMAAFLICYSLSKWHKPIHEISTTASTVMYSINAVLMFVIIFCFMMLLFWDIHHRSDKLIAKNNLLDEMAKKDPLTKLYNRRFMNYELSRRMSMLMTEGKVFGIIMGDIDNFKSINDTYGHDAGDAVLVAVSNALTGALRGDDCVCRWGGEEFLIVITGNHNAAGEVAERIRNRIENMTVETDKYTIHVTMTLGISESIPGLKVERIIQIADERLYQGKQNGKNCGVKE